MEVKILTSEVANIANSISKYIFKEVKDADRKNIEWLNEFVNFYQKLKSGESKRDYTYVEVDGLVKSDLSEIISKYIFNDLQNMDENNSSWLCEMMSIYNQLKEVDYDDNDKSASSDIGENYDSELKYKNTTPIDNAPIKKEKKDNESEKETVATIVVEDDFLEEEQEFM